MGKNRLAPPRAESIKIFMPKYGDRRADGRIFLCHQKQRLSSGLLKKYECWLNEESFLMHKKRRKDALKKWKEKNRQRQLEHQKKYRLGNGKEKRKKSTQKWKAQNKEKQNSYTYKWRNANPGKVATLRYLRRSANKNCKLNVDERAIVNNIYKLSSLCTKIFKTKYHVDHVVPVSLGGSNHPSNLRIVPAEVNLRKGNKLI
ncbi:MAG: hypothetical protein EBR82_57520 [Caulobacteraceae bacterium]|nr:hypothetical protein [Caulobacteraceae bacterium]NBX97618.1 hypothetical protein [bacterium]